MKNTKTLTLLTILFSFVACGEDSSSDLSGDASSSNVSGAYRLDKIICDNLRVSVTDYSETLTISGNNGTIASKTPQCNVTETFNYDIEKDGLAFLSSENVTCERLVDEDCHVLFKLNGSPVHYRCPESFPLAIGYWGFTKTSNGLEIKKDKDCTAYYVEI